MAGIARALGRPRSETIDVALFRAAFEIVGSDGYGSLTIERVATVSGVSKASIYRRFKSRSELAAEALLASASPGAYQSKDVVGSVERHLLHIFALVRNQAGPMLRGLMADAQLDPSFLECFRKRFIRERRLAFAEVIKAEYGRPDNMELLLDFAIGLMWYRLLVGHEELDERGATQVADALRLLIHLQDPKGATSSA